MNPASGSLTLASNVTEGLVEVTCTAPSGVPADDLIILNIERVLHRNQAKQDLAGARGSAQAADKSGYNVPGSSASGTVSQRSIKFTMPQTTCNDAGMYICSAAYFVGTIVTTATSSKNLTVTVDPGPITMMADPQQAVYSYNTSLLLRCNGPVGTVDDNTQVEWMWEYKEQGGFLWTTVTTTEDNFNEESSTPSGPGNCARIEVVALQRYVLPEDTGRTYRCYVRRVAGSGGNFEQYAAEYTIGTVLPPGVRAQDPEIIDEIWPEVQPVGGTARLNCTVTNKRNGVVIWEHVDTQQTLSMDENIVIPRNPDIGWTPKYEIQKRESGDRLTYTLVIRRLLEQDGGTYRLYSTNSTITMNPPSGAVILNSNTTSAPAEVECSPPAGENGHLYELSLKRVLRSDVNRTEENLATADADDDSNGTARDLSGNRVPGSWVTGGTAERFIRFVMPEANCGDAGTYICKAAYVSGSRLELARNFMDLTVSVVAVKTDNYYISVVPLKAEWVWEDRKAGGQWTAYSGSQEVSSSTSNTTVCPTHQASSIRLNVTTSDQGRQFRCYVRHTGDNSVSFEDFAAEFGPLSVVSPDEPDTGHGTRTSGWAAETVGILVAGAALSLGSRWN
ncbi:hypothetical protein BaRGS_00019851 [Batillaria attramentaria]|uniref:Ig-like domain-containing protein n=1 Tax=Batillaria attramentaria TaxID=370345 RepID=A0ABD0KNZ3_9CAEN